MGSVLLINHRMSVLFILHSPYCSALHIDGIDANENPKASHNIFDEPLQHILIIVYGLSLGSTCSLDLYYWSRISIAHHHLTDDTCGYR